LQAFFAAFSATLRSRNNKTGGVMADNDKSKIRYDDFISSVQPDPGKPESTIMLSGFVGHGPEGHARVYPDPTLGTWYDIPEDDIIHSIPIADSKLGGSYVWARASAQIKPGSAAAAPAPEAVQPQQAAAAGIHPTPATHCFVCDPAKAAAVMQPTPTVQTHCFICPPHTQAIHCPTHPVVCDTMLTPTPATRCFICPPHTQNCTPATVCTHAVHCPSQPVVCDTMHQTLATLCTQIGCPPPQTHQVFCPTQPVVCNLQPTQPVVCGVLPPSFGCTQGCQQGGAQPEAVMAAAVHPNTAATLCTQAPACPPHTVHNSLCICPTPSAVNQCGGPAHPTLATLCTLPPICPPGGGHTVHPTLCICATPGAHTHHAFCPPTLNAPCVTVTFAGCFTLAGCITMGACPTVAACTPFQNGVFTPFGR
jgi:hypothetical protein